MDGSVYKKVRVVGCSSESYKKAIEEAVKKAAESLEELSWFEVVETRGAVKGAKVTEWQAVVDLAFKLK